MTVGGIGSVSGSAPLVRAQAIAGQNDGDADDKATSSVKGPSAAAKVNDGDADDSTVTASMRVTNSAQAALIELQAGE